MGDRCYLELWVREDQADIIEDAMGGYNTKDPDGATAVLMSFEEVNYGGAEALGKAAAQGVEFYGWHGPGSSYGSFEFYTKDKKLHFIESGSEGGHVISGSTPEARLRSLQTLEQLLADRDEVRQRLSNPVYDLIKEAENV